MAKKNPNPWGSPKRQRSPEEIAAEAASKDAAINVDEEPLFDSPTQRPTPDQTVNVAEDHAKAPPPPPTAATPTSTSTTTTPMSTTTTPASTTTTTSTSTTPPPATGTEQNSPAPKQPQQGVESPEPKQPRQEANHPPSTRIFNLFASIRRCIKDTNILDAPSQFAIPFGSLKHAEGGHDHVIAYDTYDFATDLNSLLNAAPAWLNRALKRCSTPPVIIVRAQYGLSTIVLIKNLPPAAVFAIQPSWTSRIQWREATPSFGPPTKEVFLTLEKTYRVMGTKEVVLKTAAAQRRTLAQSSQYGGLLRGIVGLNDQHKAAFIAAGVLVMDNDSLVTSRDAQQMIVVDFLREASSETIINYLAKLQIIMGAQASLTNFRGRIKLSKAIDAAAINKVSELGKNVIRFVRQQQPQQQQDRTLQENDDILPKEKPTPELLLLTGTSGVLLIEHVHAVLQHINPKAPTSAVKAHNGRTALIRLTQQLVSQFDGTTFNKTILAVAFEKVLIQRDVEKEELRRSMERHGQSTGPTTTTTTTTSDSAQADGAPPTPE